jgi:hypothetical protein
MLKSESERIALVRTIAPLFWAFVVTRVSDWGVDLPQRIADIIGLDVGVTNSGMTIVVGIALWLTARMWPSVFERLLMWIPVDGYAYRRNDDLVIDTGRLPGAAPVVASLEPLAGTDRFAQAFIARRPSPTQLRAAAAQLLDAAERR